MVERIFIKNTGIGYAVDETGRPAYELYTQIYETLLTELGYDYARFFAEPVVDRPSYEIDWYTETDGDSELITYEQLDKAGRDSWCERSEEILKAVKTVAEDYLHSSEPGPQVIGRALLAASYGSALEDRYQLNDKPLIVFWGFRRHSNVDGEIDRPVRETVSKVSKTVNVSPAHSTVSNRPDLFGARLLWSTIVLLSLAAVTLFGLRITGIWPVGTTRIINPSQDPADAALIAKLETAIAREDATRTELSFLRERTLEHECECRLQQTAAEPEPAPPVGSNYRVKPHAINPNIANLCLSIICNPDVHWRYPQEEAVCPDTPPDELVLPERLMTDGLCHVLFWPKEIQEGQGGKEITTGADLFKDGELVRSWSFTKRLPDSTVAEVLRVKGKLFYFYAGKFTYPMGDEN